MLHLKAGPIFVEKKNDVYAVDVNSYVMLFKISDMDLYNYMSLCGLFRDIYELPSFNKASFMLFSHMSLCGFSYIRPMFSW